MTKLLLVGLCLAFASPGAFATIHKCVDERTGRVAYSDLPCRNSEAQTRLDAARLGTRSTPLAETEPRMHRLPATEVNTGGGTKQMTTTRPSGA